MLLLENALAHYGGIATTAELYSRGLTKELLHIGMMYDSILRIRHGWYASRRVPAIAVQARRAGGRLACVSALQFHGLTAPSPKLHIEVSRHASRLRSPLNWQERGERAEDFQVVVHWKRGTQAGGRLAVPVGEALRQASRCRAIVKE